MSSHKKEVRRRFRQAVFKRDNHRCRVCGKQWSPDDADPALKRINAHHITPRTEMLNGGYVAKNGVTVCENPCHERVERWYSSDGARCYPGMHPDDLYRMIGSSRTAATAASSRLP